MFVRSYSPISYLVRKITKSQWSHVAVYVGEGFVIDTDFVSKVSIRSVHLFSEVEVKRYEQLTEDELNKIVYFLVGKMNTPYDYVQIVGFLIEHLGKVKNTLGETDKYTCGELVDLAFKAAGIDLLESVDGDVTPGDLYKSKILKEINPL